MAWLNRRNERFEEFKNSVKAGVFPVNGDPLKRCVSRNFDLKICKTSGNNSVVLWNCQASQRFQGKKGISFQAFARKFHCWHLRFEKSFVCVERCIFTVEIPI